MTKTLASSARESEHVESYARNALEQVAEAFGTPLALVRIERGREPLSRVWLRPGHSVESWQVVVEASVAEVSAQGEPSAMIVHEHEDGSKLAIVAMPIQATIATGGGFGFLVTLGAGEDPAQLIEQLHPVAAVIGLGVASQLLTRAKIEAAQHGDGAVTLRVADAMRRAARYQTLQEFAFGITNALKSKTRALQVSLGIKAGTSINVQSVSGVEAADLRDTGTTTIAQAMAECADAMEVVLCQDATGSARYPLHGVWRDQTGTSCLLSLPLVDAEGCAGVVSLRRNRSEPFSTADIEVIGKAVAGIAPSMDLVRRAERGWVRHGVELVSGWRRGCLSRRRLIPNGVALTLLCALGWFLFGSMQHRLVVPSQLESKVVVHISAPFEGKIAEVLVDEGDQLEAGELMCRLDTIELELTRAELDAELRSRQLEVKQALAGFERTKASLLNAQEEVLRAKLRSIDRQLAAAQIRAATAVRVMRGDLAKRVGQVVPQGEPLFEVVPKADSRASRLVLEIPEEYALDIEVGSVVRFASNARPDEPIEMRIRLVRPSADILNQKNVFVAEAELVAGTEPDWLRVGLEGAARIDLGKAPVWRVALRGVIRFWRQELWL